MGDTGLSALRGSGSGSGLTQAQVDARIDLIVSTFAKTLTDDTSASAMLTTLGVSTFVKTLLDDAAAANFLTTLGVSAFAQTILDDAAAANVLTTLGVSAFVQTILDDAAATNVLTTLGVSTFIKTLLDDTDAATALATLGAASSARVTALEPAAANRYTASHTLDLTDVVGVEMNVGSANTLTIPLNATVAYPIGTVIEGVQYGAGATTWTATGGVTIRSRGGLVATAGQYAVSSARKIGTDEWLLAGDLA